MPKYYSLLGFGNIKLRVGTGVHVRAHDAGVVFEEASSGTTHRPVLSSALANSEYKTSSVPYFDSYTKLGESNVTPSFAQFYDGYQQICGKTRDDVTEPRCYSQ